MNRENSKTNESHRFDLTNKLSLKCPKKNMALTNLSIYYTWKNIKSVTRISNNKFLLQLEMILLIYQNDVILLQTFKITLNLSSKKHETLTENPPIQIYPNKIKKRIVFKIKTGYKLELLTPETMRLLGSTKKILIKMK